MLKLIQAQGSQTFPFFDEGIRKEHQVDYAVCFVLKSSSKLFPNIPAEVFSGEIEETFFLPEHSLYLVGCGELEKASLTEWYQYAYQFFQKYLKKWNQKNIGFVLDPAISIEFKKALIEGALFGSYSKYSLKSKEEKYSFASLVHLGQDFTEKEWTQMHEIAFAKSKTRDLCLMPANVLHPKHFEGIIVDFAKEHGLQSEVIGKPDFDKYEFAGLKALSQDDGLYASLVHVSYQPSQVKKTLALVGKGICFDTGGYSLKPTASMLDMQMDMGGAATVFGILHAIVKLNLPIAIDAYFALAENMVGPKAYKITDVITFANKKTVEIVNTDAEGRLVLADALLYAQKKPADMLIDFATLTGHVLVGLGQNLFAIMGNKLGASFAREFAQYSYEKTGEPGWEFPLFMSYKSNLKSRVADVQNSGTRYGGSIQAGLFLSEFVDSKTTWVHLDIAGSALGMEPYMKNQPTGNPVGAFLNYCLEYFV